MEELNEVIALLSHQLKEVPHPEDADEYIFVSVLYEQLAQLFSHKRELCNNDEFLVEALAAFSTAAEKSQIGAEMAPDTHEQKGNFWAKTAALENSKYELSRNLQFIDKAIVCYDQALRFLPQQSSDRAGVLLNQANCLAQRFETAESFNEADIDLAIEKAESVRQLPYISSFMRSVVENDLSTMYLDSFQHLGREQSLKHASDLAEGIVREAETTEPRLPTWKHNWSNCLLQQYYFYGDKHALEQGITQLAEADALAESSDYPHRDIILLHLSMALFARHEALKTVSDLTDAIEKAKEAYLIAPKVGHRHVLDVTLLNLSGYQHAFSQISKDPEDLDSAIEVARHVVDALVYDKPRQAKCLANLSGMLLDRFSSIDDAETRTKSTDLNEAMELSKAAQMIQNVDRHHRTIYNDLTSRLLQSQYKSSTSRHSEESLKVLSDAVSSSSQAVEIARAGSTNLSPYLIQLGDLLALKHTHTANEEDFDKAQAAYKECLHLHIGNPWDRVVSGHKSGLLYQTRSMWAEASEVLETAVLLLPRLVRNAIERDSQLQALSGLSGVSILACSMALQARRPPSTAFKILDIGRGIVAELAMATPSSALLVDLNAEGEKLRERLYSLHGVMQHPLETNWSTAGREEWSYPRVSKRSELVIEYEETEEILKKDFGFEIAQHINEPDLKALTTNAVIVNFVVDPSIAVALVVTNGEVQQVNLPKLSFETITPRFLFMIQNTPDNLRNLGFENYFDVNEKMKELLVWLWDAAVLPILKHLGIYDSSRGSRSENLQKVYWITSGIMGPMPLHAAGHHSDNSTDNTLSYVLSSYSTTMKALNKMSERSKNIPWSDIGSMQNPTVVGMPVTPNMPSFHTIPDHVHAVEQLVGTSGMEVQYVEGPSNQEVVARLPEISIAHFVCHGATDLVDPSSSGLLLRNPNNESVVDKLTVRTLATLPMSKARLVFLAACQTADNADVSIFEETVHLVSSFQILGFPDVIGTLWKAEESAALRLAQIFYQSLARQISSPTSNSEIRGYAAVAYHESVLELRSTDPDDVVTWAAFAHFGV